MSLKKRILGTLFVLLTFSLIFLINMPFFMNNSKITIDNKIESSFLNKRAVDKEIVLLYFGYVGCQTICTPALEQISKIYNELDSKKVDFYFVNLLEEVQPYVVDSFIKYFHKDFKQLDLSRDEISNLDSNFRLNLVDFDKYTINHSGFLYLLKREGLDYRVRYIYITKPFDDKAVINDVKNLIRG